MRWCPLLVGLPLCDWSGVLCVLRCGSTRPMNSTCPSLSTSSSCSLNPGKITPALILIRRKESRKSWTVFDWSVIGPGLFLSWLIDWLIDLFIYLFHIHVYISISTERNFYNQYFSTHYMKRSRLKKKILFVLPLSQYNFFLMSDVFQYLQKNNYIYIYIQIKLKKQTRHSG